MTLRATHEHEFEAAPGLPEPLPAGERLLWQGAPDPGLLARRVFHLPAVATYFGVLIAFRGATLLREQAGWAALARDLSVSVLLAGLALGLIWLLARLSAATTLYTLTDRRVVMRVGIVLSVTFNLPFSQIAGASLRPLGGRSGEIALALSDGQRIAWLHLWPHARPWRLAQPEPMLRALEDADAVGELLTWALAQQAGQAGQAGQVPAPRAAEATPSARPFPLATQG